MSTIEWIAAALGIVTILLVVGRSIWNFPFALVMVSLSFVVFVDEKLYSDALLQLFFFAINLYGWREWSRAPTVDDGVAVESMSGSARSTWIAATIVASATWGWLMATFTDAAAPYVDASVAGLSVAAQILQSLRRFESWMWWIAADVVAIPLYASRGLYAFAALYAVFLVMAVTGLIAWQRKLPERAVAA